MNDKKKMRSGIMIAAGAYLSYLGYGLIRNTLHTQNNHKIIFLLIGFLFIAIGVAVVLSKLVGFYKMKKNEFSSYETEEEEENREKTEEMTEDLKQFQEQSEEEKEELP